MHFSFHWKHTLPNRQIYNMSKDARAYTSTLKNRARIRSRPVALFTDRENRHCLTLSSDTGLISGFRRHIFAFIKIVDKCFAIKARGKRQVLTKLAATVVKKLLN